MVRGPLVPSWSSRGPRVIDRSLHLFFPPTPLWGLKVGCFNSGHHMCYRYCLHFIRVATSSAPRIIHYIRWIGRFLLLTMSTHVHIGFFRVHPRLEFCRIWKRNVITRVIICRPATCKVFTGKGTGVANSENNLVKGNNCYRQPPRGPTSSTQKTESVRSSDSVQVKSIVIGHCPSYSFGGHWTHLILTLPSPPRLS